MIDSKSEDPSVATEDDLSDPNVRRSSTPINNYPCSYRDGFQLSRMPACKWGEKETVYYRLHHESCEARVFFGLPGDKLRAVQWHRPEYADFLTQAMPEEYQPLNAGQDKVLELLELLKNIQNRDWTVLFPQQKADYSGMESLTDQAIKIIFQLLGLERQGSTVVRTQTRIALQQQGEFSRVTIDTAIVDREYTFYLLLLTENKPWDADNTPFGQLMAGAIAAFQYNNMLRFQAGKPSLEFMILPGIIWIGSIPSFYRIKVTKELADAVRSGQRPQSDTYVAELRPSIPKIWMGYGLWRLHNRPVIMKILENLKDFIPSNCDDIPVGWFRFMTQAEADHVEKIRKEESATEWVSEEAAVARNANY